MLWLASSALLLTLGAGPACGQAIDSVYTRHDFERCTLVSASASLRVSIVDSWLANDERRRGGYRAFGCIFSILSQISAAMSGPPKFLIARMPVGEVTLISVR